MQNGVNALSKMPFKNLFFFFSKTSHFEHVEPYNLVQISPAYGPITYQIMYGDHDIPIFENVILMLYLLLPTITGNFF